MKYVSAIVIASVALVLSAPAQAQTFTFQSTAGVATTVGGPMPNGGFASGASWTGSTSVTWADGKKTSDNYTCISTTQPPNGKIFDSHVICDSTGPTGKFTSIWGCNFTSADRTATNCVGGLVGHSGMYAGKRGGITFAGTNGAGSGTGQWGG